MCTVLTHLVKNCTLVYDGCFDATRIGEDDTNTDVLSYSAYSPKKMYFVS